MDLQKCAHKVKRKQAFSMRLVIVEIEALNTYSLMVVRYKYKC